MLLGSDQDASERRGSSVDLPNLLSSRDPGARRDIGGSRVVSVSGLVRTTCGNR